MDVTSLVCDVGRHGQHDYVINTQSRVSEAYPRPRLDLMIYRPITFWDLTGTTGYEIHEDYCIYLTETIVISSIISYLRR